MPKSKKVYSNIIDLRSVYYSLASDKQELLNLITEAEISEQVYNSNAIENSTLSLEETDKILEQIDLDRFISQREIFEARNLARVVQYINQKAKQQEISVEIILLLHKMLIGNIRDDVAGRFRNSTEWVRVGSHIAPDPRLVPELIEQMLVEYFSHSHESIVKRLARLHLTFEHIHPFVDGNGRIGRAINNYILIREGYVPINIKFLDRATYYKAFNEFDNDQQTQTMEQIIALSLSNSYHKRITYLKAKKIIPLQDFAKQSKQSYASLLNKANRQTIPAFIERGKWKIGVEN
jgi:Fic family protein